MPRPSPDEGANNVVGLEPRQLGLGEVYFRTSDAVVVAEAGVGRVVLWNEAAARVFGYSPAEARGILIEDLIPGDFKASHRAGLARFGRDGVGALIDSGAVVELPAIHRDGRPLHVEMSLTSLRAPHLPGRYVMAIVRDVTERKRLEDELRRTLLLVEETQALSKVGSWEWDTTMGPHRGVVWSRQMYRLNGVDPDTFEMSQASVEALIHPDDLATWQTRLANAAWTRTDVERFSYRVVHPDGTVRWLSGEGHFDPERPRTLIGFVQDITEQKAATDELERIALFDELTGLRNRRGFFATADALLQLARRERRNVVLLYVDLDDMKRINDEYGHAAGDQALVAAADVLSSTLRESDLVARLGGDEFCVLLREGDIEAPVARIRAALTGRRVGDHPLSLTVGAAIERWDEPTSIDELVARADAAMYAEKPNKVRDTGE